MVMSRPPSTGRFARALIPRDEPVDDGRDHPANPNPPVGTVGPNVPAGFGDTHVMYPAVSPPAQAEAWSGWPVEWGTPYYETTPTHWTFFGGGFAADDPAGYLRRVSTVMTCIDKSSRQLASFPVYAVKDRIPVPMPEWYKYSPEPQLYADWSEFMKTAVNDYLRHGETILWRTATFADGFPQRFIALNPCEIDVDDDGFYWQHTRNSGLLLGRADQAGRSEICHIKYQRSSGPSRRGVGPLAWTGAHLVSAAVLEDYAVNIARYGVSALLRHPGELTAEQAADLRHQWIVARDSHRGVPAVLSGGLEYDQLSLSPRDMALLDLKVFDLQMIATAFGVPPGLVGLPQAGGGLEYSSVDMLSDHHWRDALRPIAQSFSGALSNWLLPRGTVLEFNPDRYVQPGFAERVPAYATLASVVDDEGRAAMTVNEIRIAERFEPYPDETVPPSDTTTDIDGLIGAAHG